MTTRPRVLLTRARGRNDTLRQALEPHVQPVEVPLLAFERLPHTLPPADWILLTSGTVLQMVDAAHLQTARLAVVGPRTQRAVEALGLTVDLCPPVALASALADALVAEGVSGARVLYPRAERVDADLEQRLTAAGATVTSPAVYRTICPSNAVSEVRKARPVAAVCLASGSAARHLVDAGGGDLPVVCIGPSTEQVARDLGLTVLAVAEEHTAEGLAQATLAALSV